MIRNYVSASRRKNWGKIVWLPKIFWSGKAIVRSVKHKAIIKQLSLSVSEFPKYFSSVEIFNLFLKFLSNDMLLILSWL